MSKCVCGCGAETMCKRAKRLWRYMKCYECCRTSMSCRFAKSYDGRIVTFCCKNCDVDGSAYNGRAEDDKEPEIFDDDDEDDEDIEWVACDGLGKLI